MFISCLNFENNDIIPDKYTCTGENISPSIRIAEIPLEALSLALIVEDPDVPNSRFTHWIMWNINPKIEIIFENEVPGEASEGINDFGKSGYSGPCPQSGTHRYYFRMYALSSILTLEKNATRLELENSMTGNVIEVAEIIGLYSKK